MEKYINQVIEYRDWLLDKRTTVMGNFAGPRVPTNHIVPVLVAACVDRLAIDECKKQNIALLGPLGGDQGIVPACWPSYFHLSEE